ncbi:MAG: ABC transporter permease subunit [Candidatus Aquicultor sp.]|nr:ABC transporter permease subunit [Candidatus Aquicultor sp.]
MLIIARLTFKEALRKKILVAAIILSVLFLTVYGVGLHYATNTIEQQTAQGVGRGMDNGSIAGADIMVESSKKLLILLGLYFSSSIVSLLAILSSVGVVSSEIENGIIHAMMAKPIRRRDIILGKFGGYAAMLSVYSALLFLSVLLLNYFIAGAALGNVPLLIALFIIQPLVFLAVTLAGSTAFSTLANGIAAFTLYIASAVGGMLEQIGAMLSNDMLVNTGIVTSLLMPADAIYRMIASLVTNVPGGSINAMFFGPFGAMSAPSTAMVVYAIFYLVGFVGLASSMFSRKDIG